MIKTQEVTCRYGVTYKATFLGSKGEVERSFDNLTRCCCWMCRNHDCTKPENQIIPECGDICRVYTNVPYCVRSIVPDLKI